MRYSGLWYLHQTLLCTISNPTKLYPPKNCSNVDNSRASGNIIRSAMPAAGTPHRNCPTEDIASRFVWTSAPLRRYGSGSSNLRMLRILKIPDQNNWHRCCPKFSKPSDYSVQAAKDDPFRAVLILLPSPKRDQYDSSYPLWM